MTVRIAAIGTTVNSREIEYQVSALPVTDSYTNCYGSAISFERAKHLFSLGQAVYCNGLRLVDHITRPLYRSKPQ